MFSLHTSVPQLLGSQQVFFPAAPAASVTVPPASLVMDRALQRLASKLATFIDCSPEWPRSDALGRAEALAQELLSVLRNDWEADFQWRRNFYNKNVKIRALQKNTGEHVEVQPPTGEALARQRWPFRHVRVAQVCGSMVAGSLQLTTSTRRAMPRSPRRVMRLASCLPCSTGRT